MGDQEERGCQFGHMDARHARIYVQRISNRSRRDTRRAGRSCQYRKSRGRCEVYRTEWCIYAPDEDVAGSIDMVLNRRDSAVFYLVDWKRSEKLEDKYNGFGKTMKSPLESVADCQGQH